MQQSKRAEGNRRSVIWFQTMLWYAWPYIILVYSGIVSNACQIIRMTNGMVAEALVSHYRQPARCALRLEALEDVPLGAQSTVHVCIMRVHMCVCVCVCMCMCVCVYQSAGSCACTCVCECAQCV